MLKKQYSKERHIPPANRTKWGNILLKGREEPIAVLTEAAIVATYLKIGIPEFMQNLRESAYNFRHAGKTVEDAVRGGPEGMRAAKNLEQSIMEVQSAIDKNQEAAQALQKLYTSRNEFVTNLLEVYKANENVSQICGKLSIQLKGAYKSLSQAGNDLKPEWWEVNIDAPIIDYYGKVKALAGDKSYQNLSKEQRLEKALENSEKLREFYVQARQFYDAKEKNESTVNEFCSFLAKTQDSTAAQNQNIEQLFPKLISSVKEGYTVEDYLIQVDSKGTKMTKDEVITTGQNVTGYKEQVNTTRDDTGRVVPLQPYDASNWVDFAVNPAVLALAAVLLYKGVTRYPGLKQADSLLSKAIAAPFKLAGNMIGEVYRAASDYIRNHSQKGE